MPEKPLLRDDSALYGKLMTEMFHEFVVSDTFCSMSRQEREERVGAYEEINMLIDSMIENKLRTDPENMENRTP